MMHRWIVTTLALLALGTLAAQPAPRAADAADTSFVQQVVPVLAKHCVGCHGGAKPKADLALDRFKTDAGLPKDRPTWEKVAQMLRKREMPPDSKPQPAQAERDRVVAWIDGELARLDRTGKRDPGRVTIRRLNRVEYNHTIRDLLGVAITPADDFPADDVGYGFDNIGDVLSMPPILLEKYLAAADKIVAAAIFTEDSLKGEVRKFEGKTLQCTLKDLSGRGFKALFTNGEVFTPCNFPIDGDYVIRARAYGQQAGPDPCKLAFKIDGKDLHTVDVKAEENSPQVYEHKAKVQAGQRRVAAAFTNDWYNAKEADPKKRDRNLYIEYVEIQGPLGVKREPPDSHKRIVICTPTGEADWEECAGKILERFAARAYRRPVNKQEVARLVYLVKLARQNGDSFDKGIQLAVKATLVSPHFLFRVEIDPQPKNPDAIHTIGEFELASRLSYFLWASMPDDELFEQAKQGNLRKNLDAQVGRMIKDPKARALVDHFAGQWLNVRSLKSDPGRYPPLDEALRADMLRETDLFFETVMKEDRSLLELIDADFTFVNERLARHYGIEGVSGDQFRRVKLANDQRGGLLTQASVLTVTSNPTRTSPVKRGKWILENILGTPPPPPPPDVPELSESKKVADSASLRKRMELHREKAICASCHQRMDPLGFGFENYDLVGAWRTKDGKFDIDPAGTLPSGKSFKGPKELKAILLEQKALFARCLTEKMLTYALGRGLESYDRQAVDQIVADLGKTNYKFSTLLLGIVKSDPFQKRRGQ